MAACGGRIRWPGHNLGPPNRPAPSVCRGTSYEVSALDFSAEPAPCLLSAGRGAAKLWDVADGTCLLDLTIGNILNAVAFAPDGRHLVVSRAPGFGGGVGVDARGTGARPRNSHPVRTHGGHREGDVFARRETRRCNQS